MQRARNCVQPWAPSACNLSLPAFQNCRTGVQGLNNGRSVFRLIRWRCGWPATGGFCRPKRCVAGLKPRNFCVAITCAGRGKVSRCRRSASSVWGIRPSYAGNIWKSPIPVSSFCHEGWGVRREVNWPKFSASLWMPLWAGCLTVEFRTLGCRVNCRRS